jgi:ribosomal protein L28
MIFRKNKNKMQNIKQNRTRRKWLPNVHHKKIWSDLMQRNVSVTLTANALRTIDKKGGFDNYLLFTKNEKIGSEWGIKMKNILIRLWEQKSGKKFNAREIMFKTKHPLPRTGGVDYNIESTNVTNKQNETQTNQIPLTTTANISSGKNKTVQEQIRQFSTFRKLRNFQLLKSIKKSEVTTLSTKMVIVRSLDDLD